MNKTQCYEEIRQRLENQDSEIFARLMCNFFDSNTLTEFVEFLKDEGF